MSDKTEQGAESAEAEAKTETVLVRIVVPSKDIDFEVKEPRARDMEALQLQTRMKMKELKEILDLEMVQMRFAIFCTWRQHGRIITWDEAGELLDIAEGVTQEVPVDGEPDVEAPADPTEARTDSAPGDDVAE